jgi:hypothetical protein
VSVEDTMCKTCGVFFVLHNTQNYRIPYSHYSTAQKANKHNKLTQTPTKHRKPTTYVHQPRNYQLVLAMGSENLLQKIRTTTGG